MKTFALAIAAVLASALVACSSSSSDEAAPAKTHLYATKVATSSTSGSALVELNPTTGEFVRFIGTVAYGVNGMDWDPHSNRLLATTTSWDAHAPSCLIRIDPATADATLIGTTTPENLVNLAANAQGGLYSWTESSDDLVSLSTTGVAHVIADSTINSWTHSLKFDRHGTLWFLNGNTEVYVMDWVTGLGSSVGNLGLPNYAHHGDFNPATAKFWAIDATSNPRNFVVVTFDPLEVVTTFPAPDDIHVLAFRK
jgi:hypothetical protein